VKAVVFRAPGSVAVVDRPEPERRVGEVLVAPVYVGLCGTDLELLNGSMPYFAQGRAALPLQPGHEVAGVVVDRSDGDVPVGTSVVIDPIVGCGDCPQCAEGRATHCADRFEMGVRGGMDGGAAELLAVPGANVHPIPDGVSFREAVLTEPGVTALNGLRRIGHLQGCALVIGSGTLGGIAAQLLAARGLQVDVLARDERRAELIQSWGAGLRTTANDSVYDIVVEAAGTADAVRASLRAVAPGGSIALLGVQGQQINGIDVDALVLKDVSVYGVLNGPGLYGSMLEEIASGHVSADRLVDSEFALADAPAAFERLGSKDRVRPKVLLRVATA
jgi:threonine dehydrogenase-like Zn-dependent dehydrogenase